MTVDGAGLEFSGLMIKKRNWVEEPRPLIAMALIESIRVFPSKLNWGGSDATRSTRDRRDTSPGSTISGGVAACGH